MGTHSTYSPSQTPRNIRCPGSTAFVKYLIQKGTIPPEETSSYAEEGTMMHGQIERKINGLKFTEVLDGEQQGAIEDGLTFLQSIMQEHGITSLTTEQRVSLTGFSIDDADGTADVLGVGSINGKSSLHILDWKFGQGVPVFVEKNEQLMHYLLGAIALPESFDIYDELWIHLAQPRLNYYGSYLCHVDELWGLINAIKNAQKSHDIIPGDKQCLWCRGKTRCVEYDTLASERAITVFSAADAMAKNEFDFAKMKKMLELEPFFKKVFKAIKDEINVLKPEQLRDIGLKRVAGKSFRGFASEDGIVEFICENYPDAEMYDTKLKSPSQLEKTIPGLKKDPGFKRLIIKPKGAPTVVSAADKRDDYDVSDTAVVFGALKKD